MIAVILSEISGWLKNESRVNISVLVALLGVIGSFTLLRPEFCLELITGVILWVAIRTGEESWSEFWVKDWVKRANLSLRTVIIGKVLATTVICLIQIAFILPVLVIMQVLWGFMWLQLVNALLMITIAATIAAGLGLCGSSLGKEGESGLTGALVIVWLLATAFPPLLRLVNPFYFVWQIFDSGDQALSIIHLVNLGLIALIVLGAERLFRKEAY